LIWNIFADPTNHRRYAAAAQNWLPTGSHMVAKRTGLAGGKMLRMRLTKHSVDVLQVVDDEVRIWDTTVAGFGIRCRRGGNKFYFLKYRLPNGRQRWATIGRHGSPWTVETARREARRLSGQIVDGEDPVEAKAVERTDLTLSQLCDLYLGQPIVITSRGTAKKASSLTWGVSSQGV
jgi:hypothetical protein